MFQRLVLGPRLSAVSWFFIELFALTAVLFLPFSKSVAEAGITVALALWALRKFPWNERFPRLPPCNVFYLLFLFFVVISLYRIPQEHLWDGFRGFVKWFQSLAVFFMAVDWFAEARRRERFLAVFLLMTGLLCLNGFWQLAMGYDLVKGYTADLPGRFVRVQSSLHSPNDLAAFLLLALPPIFIFWAKEKTWSPKSALWAFFLVGTGLTFLLTLSRSGFLALALSVAAYALFSGRKKILLPLAAGFAALLVSGALRYNFFESLNLRDTTIGERLTFWRMAWDLVRDHPWLGGGINTFYQRFAAAAAAGEPFRGYAHNCYLQMWTEVGIFGLMAFFAPAVFLFSKWALGAARDKTPFRLDQALGTGLFAYFIQSFFDTNFYGLQTALVFWVIWGFFAARIQFE